MLTYRRHGELVSDEPEVPGPITQEHLARAEDLPGAPIIDRNVAVASGPGLAAVQLHGVRLHAVTEQQCIEHILNELDAGNGGVVVTPNLDHLRRCTRDLSFNALVAEADLVVADGMPLIWASRLQRTPLPQRIAGSDLISSLSAEAARRNRSVFLLGGAPGTADKAARVLKEASPTLRVAGTYCPPYGFENDQREIEHIITLLTRARPDVIFVALGSPKQEYLIQRIRFCLPGAWWLGVGVSFSFLSGEVPRAPLWMQRIGMEWLHRLAQEPRRLFRRYIIVGIPFGARLLSTSFFNGLPRRFGRNGQDAERRPAVTVAGNYASNGNGHRRHHARRNGNGNGHAGGNGAATASRIRADRRHLARPRVASAPVGDRRKLHRLRALVLLGGAVRSTPFAEAIERSVLDLPLDAEGSIFNRWLAHARDLARHAEVEKLPVRVLVNRNAHEPISAAPAYYGTFRVERDLSEYRGTAGVLRDLATDYDDDDLILVANAAQVLLDPLSAIARALERKQGDVSLLSHNDGTPSGVMLVTCKTLRVIPDSGFVDMKEQALPEIASRYDVTVIHRRGPSGLPVRSLSDYIMALRHYHSRRLGKPTLTDPLAEDWLPAFAIVEQGAMVHPQAHVHDAVVLKGAVVEPGAVVVRSVVCPGGVVRRDRSAVDQLVLAHI